MDKSLILNKIKNHIGIDTDKDFAKFLGIKPTTLSMWHKRNTYDAELLFTKCDFLNAETLLVGNGNLFKSITNKVNEPEETNKTQARPIIEINPEAKANCLVADIKASAGFGSLMQSSTKLEELPAITLLNAPFGLNVAFPIQGDSMHNTIRHSDYVAGNLLTDINDLKDGHVYIVIERGNGATCKRVYKTKKGYRIVSDNPTYPEYPLEHDDVIAFFKAFERLSRDFRNYFDDVRVDVAQLKDEFKTFKKQITAIQKRLK